MKVEVLYITGCPSYAPTLAMLRAVVRELGVAAEIVEVEVRNAEDARRLRFLGSPSVREEGIDIEPSMEASEADALACRM